MTVEEDVSLAELSRWKIGGPAAALVEPSTADEVAAVASAMAERREPLVVVGDCSNILFDDRGFRGLVMRIGRRMARVRIDGVHVRAEAGAWVPLFARRLGSAGLSGAEHTIGIPGTLGGLVVMNGGSLRRAIGTNVVSVTCVDRRGGLHEIDNAACGFAYRTSRLQHGDAILVHAELEFERRAPASIRREMLKIMADRRRKFPKQLPNCGSTFLSDAALFEKAGPPGLLIEKAGLKGERRGGAQISPVHANFIVNLGNASTEDILWLIRLARKRVHENTGHLMNCEVRHVSPDGLVRPAHESAEERAPDA